MLVTKQLTVAIDFNSIGKNTMEVNGYHQLSIESIEIKLNYNKKNAIVYN